MTVPPQLFHHRVHAVAAQCFVSSARCAALSSQKRTHASAHARCVAVKAGMVSEVCPSCRRVQDTKPVLTNLGEKDKRKRASATFECLLLLTLLLLLHKMSKSRQKESKEKHSRRIIKMAIDVQGFAALATRISATVEQSVFFESWKEKTCNAPVQHSALKQQRRCSIVKTFVVTSFKTGKNVNAVACQNRKRKKGMSI